MSHLELNHRGLLTNLAWPDDRLVGQHASLSHKPPPHYRFMVSVSWNEPNWWNPVFISIQYQLGLAATLPLTFRKMIPQVSPECVIKGLVFLHVHYIYSFCGTFSRLTSRVRRLVFTSWLPIGIPKNVPHPTPLCLSGMCAGPLRLGA